MANVVLNSEFVFLVVLKCVFCTVRCTILCVLYSAAVLDVCTRQVQIQYICSMTRAGTTKDLYLYLYKKKTED